MMRPVVRRLARPFRNQAKAAQAQGRWAEALFNLQLARRVDGDNVGILLQIGNMQNELADYAKAEASFREASNHPEFRLRAEIGLAGVAERRNDWWHAVLHWEDTLKIMAAEQTEDANAAAGWPMSPALVLLHTSLCRHYLNDPSASERDLLLAFALEPKVRRLQEAVLMRARVLSNVDVRGAYRMLKAAHRRYPDDFAILFELTKATVICGERPEAEQYAAALVAMNPSDEGAQAMIRDRGLVLPRG